MKKEIIAIVDAPEITLAEHQKPGDALLNFYRVLGWNGKDYLDPCKIRTTQDVYKRLYDFIHSKCPDPVTVGIFMANSGPGTDDYVPQGKVYLLKGWTIPAKSQTPGEITDEH